MRELIVGRRHSLQAMLSPVAGCALTLVGLVSVSAPRLAAAQAFTDPTGDYRAGYVGAGNPATPEFDVIGGSVTFDGSAFTFRGILAGTVSLTGPANQAYIFGVNRGAGTARFAALGLTNILFDAVVISRPNGPDQFNVCFPTACNADLPSAAVFSGNTFQVVVPASLLPSTGFALTDYTFNLWPRLIGQNGGDANLEISDFAPNAMNVGVSAVSAVPEPATALLLAPALAALAIARRRRSR